MNISESTIYKCLQKQIFTIKVKYQSNSTTLILIDFMVNPKLEQI